MQLEVVMLMALAGMFAMAAPLLLYGRKLMAGETDHMEHLPPLPKIGQRYRGEDGEIHTLVGIVEGPCGDDGDVDDFFELRNTQGQITKVSIALDLNVVIGEPIR